MPEEHLNRRQSMVNDNEDVLNISGISQLCKILDNMEPIVFQLKFLLKSKLSEGELSPIAALQLEKPVKLGVRIRHGLWKRSLP